MKNSELVSQKHRLDTLFTRTDGRDAELQSHWARYLCVLVVGFLENSIEILLLEFARQRADPRVLQFVSRELSQFQNPKFGKIAELLGKFSTAWRMTLEERTHPEQRDAVDSVVNNRHRIAHGEQSGISLGTMKSYCRAVIKFVEFLESSVIQ